MSSLISTPLNSAFVAEHVVLSVMGPHAGEDEAAIFSRKAADIDNVRSTLWLYRSHLARPDRAQAFFSDSRDCFALFLAASAKNGARPTTITDRATTFSTDNAHWQSIPKISPVTGRFPAYALVFSEISLCVEEHFADLGMYASEDPATPVKFRLGASTTLAQRTDMTRHPLRMKSRFRRVIAIARLAPPFAVWIK